MALARILKAFSWRCGEWNCCGWRCRRCRTIVRRGFEILMRSRCTAVARDERLRWALCFAGLWLGLIGAAFDERAARDRGRKLRLRRACCCGRCGQSRLGPREDRWMRCWTGLRGAWLHHAAQGVYFGIG